MSEQLQQGLAHFHAARFADAAAAFRGALARQPHDASLWNNYAAALTECGHTHAAADALREALRLDPDSIEAISNLASTLDRAGRPIEAAELYRRALARVASAPIWSNLGNVLRAAGRSAEAIAAYREAIRLDPTLTRAHSNMLLVLNYVASLSAQRIADEHREFGRRLAARTVRKPAREHVAGKPLRVGFVSADLRDHPVARLLLPVLREHATCGQQWLLYAQNTRCDATSAELREAADGWCDIAGLDDDALEARIRADRIDVLVDLSGHTAGNRLPFFARHAAPVQASWLGYAGTTGLAAIDWIIADAHTVPAEDEGLYVERIWRLPHAYVAYGAPSQAGAVAEPPCLRSGHVTFGVFNNVAKVTPHVIATWAQILRRLPDARLLMKNRAFAGDALRAELAGRFAQHGIEPARLLFEGESIGADYYASYARIDIALDPFPFPGLMTSLDTLWMGVPLVTMAGQRGMLSRHGELLADCIGQHDWVCADEAAYVDRAVGMASDPHGLARWRGALRAQLAASALGAPARLAADLAGAFEAMADEASR